MWIARDKNKHLFIYTEKPVRDEFDSTFFTGGECFELNKDEFPEVTWENSPMEIKTVTNNGISIDWEQRRYEIAKDALAALISDPTIRGAYASFSKVAVDHADALIEELKKEQK